MWKWLSWVWRIGAALFAAWVIYALCASWYWQITVGKPIETEFGFRIGSPVIQVDGTAWPREVVNIESLRWDGVLGQAGFREGDLVCGLSVSQLFKVLQRGRGEQVTLQVMNGGHGLPLNQRQVRIITFKVPPVRK